MPGEGTALNNLGLSLHGEHRYDEAITAHQDAAEIFRHMGDVPKEAVAQANLGCGHRRARSLTN